MPKPKADDIILSTTQIGAFFGVTGRQVARWADKGCPKEKYGQFNLKAVFDWWLDNIQSDKDVPGMTEFRTVYWGHKARAEKVKADKLEESVIAVDDFIDAWAWRVAEMSNGLGGLPMRLSPLVVGKKEVDVRQILDAEIWKIRDKYARTGNFIPEIDIKNAPKKPKAKKLKKVASKRTAGRKTS